VTEAAELLFVEHGPWARGIARSLMRKLPPSFDVDDMMQSALIGLWKAAERFDGSMGVPFIAFAHPWVQGECWMAVRRKSYTEATHAELHDTHVGREPGPEAAIQRERVMAVLRESIEYLPEGSRERDLVSLYYLHGWQMVEVAGQLGLSERTCFEIRRSALGMMREHFKRRRVEAQDVVT